LGHDAEALAAFRKAREEDPKRRDLYDDTILVYARLNDHESMARMAMEQVLVFGLTQETARVAASAFAALPGGECALEQSGNQLRIDYACPAAMRALCAAGTELAAAHRAGRRTEDARGVEAAVAERGCPRTAP